MTVAELEDRISVAELHRWAAFEADEPFLSTRVDLAGGIVASVLANVNRGRSAAPFSAMDFMPILATKREQDNIEAARLRQRFPAPLSDEDAMLQRMVAAYG